MSISMVALRPIQSPMMPKRSCPIRMPMSCRYVVACVHTYKAPQTFFCHIWIDYIDQQHVYMIMCVMYHAGFQSFDAVTRCKP